MHEPPPPDRRGAARPGGSRLAFHRDARRDDASGHDPCPSRRAHRRTGGRAEAGPPGKRGDRPHLLGRGGPDGCGEPTGGRARSTAVVGAWAAPKVSENLFSLKVSFSFKAVMTSNDSSADLAWSD